MAVVRITSSKRAIQFVDDDGHMFQTSALYLKTLLEGGNPAGYILLSRLPFDAAPDRFKKSPVYLGGTTQIVEGQVVDQSNDGLSKKKLEDKKEAAMFSDKKVN